MSRSLLVGSLLALILTLGVQQGSHPVAAAQGPMMQQPLDQLAGDEFDRAFLREMTMHHAMAVMMARPLINAAPHPEVQELARNIIADQTREIAQMRSWARTWYGLEIPDPIAMMDSMMHGSEGTPTGMMDDHGMPMGSHPGESMPDMAGMSMMDMHEMSMMQSLATLPAPRREVVFLSLMIPHHQDAVDMAHLASERAAHAELIELARTIEASQTAEMQQMNAWLAGWYGL